jgi:hypothetical protein
MKSITTTTVSHSKDQWLEKFFRFGLISKGIVYCLLGVLTVLAAIGLRGKNASKTDAFDLIYAQPFGKVLLIVITLGLFGFVTLRLFQSFKDIDHKGDDTKGVVHRIGYAAKLALSGSHGNGDSKQFIVTKVLALPAGVWIVGIAAIIIIISGGYQVYKGASGKFMEKIQLVGTKFSEVFRKAGIVGYISRGVVLLVIGYLLFHSAIEADPGSVQDTDGAFSFLENNFGSFLMGLIALGLVGYGVFMFVKAKYERITG